MLNSLQHNSKNYIHTYVNASYKLQIIHIQKRKKYAFEIDIFPSEI